MIMFKRLLVRSRQRRPAADDAHSAQFNPPPGGSVKRLRSETVSVTPWARRTHAALTNCDGIQTLDKSRNHWTSLALPTDRPGWISNKRQRALPEHIKAIRFSAADTTTNQSCFITTGYVKQCSDLLWPLVGRPDKIVLPAERSLRQRMRAYKSSAIRDS